MHAPLRTTASDGGWRLFPGPLRKSQAVNGNLVPLLHTWVRTWCRVWVGTGVTEEPDNEVILFTVTVHSVPAKD